MKNRFEPKLFFYGHNCFLIETSNNFLVIDPWLSDRGAFYGSWFQYPKNHHLQDRLVELSKNKQGFVYLTHEHQDHFDVDTISKMSPATKFIIPNFQDKFLYNYLLNNKYDVSELDPDVPLEISNEITIKILITDIGVDHDSAIFIETEKFRFLNQNDCRIFDRLHPEFSDLDYYSVQFSGANHHPACYESYTPKLKAAISHEKVISKLNTVAKAISTLKPKYYIPAAGPAIFPFLDEELTLSNDNIFIHQDYLKDFLDSKNITNVIYPRPGEEIHEGSSRTPIGSPTKAELLDYQSSVINIWENLSVSFDKKKLENVIRARLHEIKDINFKTEFVIQFVWGEASTDTLFIDLESSTISSSNKFKKNIYKISAEKKYFALMHSSARWQDISLTLRGKAWRKPDVFDNVINIFLFSEINNIKESLLSSLSIPNERAIVNGVNSCRYEIDRFCPHQGADLKFGQITEDNEIVCPRHGWKFSLDKRGQSSNGKASIRSIKIKD